MQKRTPRTEVETLVGPFTSGEVVQHPKHSLNSLKVSEHHSQEDEEVFAQKHRYISRSTSTYRNVSIAKNADIDISSISSYT